MALLTHTGPLGVEVYPLTLEFRDRVVECEWQAKVTKARIFRPSIALQHFFQLLVTSYMQLYVYAATLRCTCFQRTCWALHLKLSVHVSMLHLYTHVQVVPAYVLGSGKKAMHAYGASV